MIVTGTVCRAGVANVIGSWLPKTGSWATTGRCWSSVALELLHRVAQIVGQGVAGHRGRRLALQPTQQGVGERAVPMAVGHQVFDGAQPDASGEAFEDVDVRRVRVAIAARPNGARRPLQNCRRVRVAQVSAHSTISLNAPASARKSVQLVTSTLGGRSLTASAVTSAACLRRVAHPCPLI